VVEIHHVASFQPLTSFMAPSEQQRPPIRYTVRFPAPQSHYAGIEARFPTDGKRQIEVFLPVWTPGSYLVREYARNLEGVSCSNGSITKTRKNRWRVDLDNLLDEVIITYRIYCHELTVRTNYLDEDFALLIGAATFLTLVDDSVRRHQVTLELPPGWRGSWSGMAGKQNAFEAPDYDALVDCPIVAGNPALYGFTVDGKPHLIVNVGDEELWNPLKSVRDVRKIVMEHRAMWGSLPYDNYFFFNLLTGGRGALEHRNSMVVMADRFTTRKRSSYTAWLEVVSHEFFHVWNVKRLRPVELGPFDYENEVYTRNLWIAEGFTEYYGTLALRRAGLITDEEFLGGKDPGNPTGCDARGGTESLSRLIAKLQGAPGRTQQPVSLASFDAWIKLYRPDENSLNASISYYIKGAVIAWLLDAKIRAATGDARSLDHVMRLAWLRHGHAAGFSSEQFYQVAQEVAGTDLTPWFTDVVDSTAELDYSEALAWFGLRFKRSRAKLDDTGHPKAWPGFSTRNECGRVVVAQVPSDGPARAAGISPEDEILGIDNYRVRSEQWEQRLEQYRPDEDVSLLVARRERLMTVPLRLAENLCGKWLLEVDPEASSLQTQHLQKWLSPSSGSAGSESQEPEALPGNDS
jgi:predicted metalloprotease with PDZ domain